jgi:hypothetical protein
MIDKVRYGLSTFLILVGLFAWIQRPPYVQPSIPSHGRSFNSEKSLVEIGDLSEICAPLSQESGYLLISGQIDARVQNTPAGYFQTADLETGLFFELDPGEDSLIRLGLRSSDGTTQRLKFDNLRRDGSFNFGFLLTANGDLRMVGDGKNLLTELPELDIACNNFRIGAANGNLAGDTNIRFSISSGTNSSEVESFLTDYNMSYTNSLPSELYKWPLYIGSLLLLLGNLFKWRRNWILAAVNFGKKP